MNKAELIKAVATETGFTQKDVATCLDTINEAKIAGLKEDGIVKDGLFTHKIKVTSPRIGVNPRNPEQKISIEAKNKVTTKNSVALVKMVEQFPIKND